MEHIVERILDGLPEYLKEDYPKFVELLRAYYTWQAQGGKFLSGVFGHESVLDIDSSGLERVIAEIGETDVPPAHRRAFLAFSRDFNTSRGSRASFVNFFRIFFDAPARITNSSQFVFMPSAAVREHYRRAIVTSASALPTSGVLHQSFGGGQADVVAANCLGARGGIRTYELIVVIRKDSFFQGAAVMRHGDETFGLDFVPYIDFSAVAGAGYQVGDAVEVTADFMSFKGRVKTLQPVELASVHVATPGVGYLVGNVVTIPGARGYRAEVSAVDEFGGIAQIRVIDQGDPFGGVPEFRIATTSGTGAALEFDGIAGRPDRVDFEMQPFGEVAAVEIASETGLGAAFTTSPRLFQDAWIPRGYNGVLGVGSKLTDSAAYQDASYIVSTPVDLHKWGSKVRELLHPAGRYMHAVKTAGSAVVIPSTLATTSGIRPYEHLGMGLAAGDSIDIDAVEVPLPVTMEVEAATGETSDAGLDVPAP